MANPGSQPRLGRLLYEFLVDDEAVDAFVYEHYPEVRKRFTADMSRGDKLALLLQQEEAPRLVEKLRQMALVPQGDFQPPASDHAPPEPPRPGPGADPVLERLYLGGDPAVLRRGHERQWAALLRHLSQREGQLVIVHGAHDGGLATFCLRLLHSTALRRSGCVLEVRWPLQVPTAPAFPRDRGACLEALGLALSCAPSDLAPVLQRRLGQKALILVHPRVRDVTEAEGLLSYYTEWLPETMSRVRAVHPLHCVQPIEWFRPHPLHWVAATVIAGLWPGEPAFVRRVRERQRAREVIGRLRRAGQQLLKVNVLPPLLESTAEGPA